MPISRLCHTHPLRSSWSRAADYPFLEYFSFSLWLLKEMGGELEDEGDLSRTRVLLPFPRPFSDPSVDGASLPHANSDLWESTYCNLLASGLLCLEVGLHKILSHRVVRGQRGASLSCLVLKMLWHLFSVLRNVLASHLWTWSSSCRANAFLQLNRIFQLPQKKQFKEFLVRLRTLRVLPWVPIPSSLAARR